MKREMKNMLITAAILCACAGTVTANAVMEHEKDAIVATPSEFTDAMEQETLPSDVSTETEIFEEAAAEEAPEIKDVVIKTSGNKVFFYKNAKPIENKFVSYDGSVYHTDPYGRALTGFRDLYGYPYHFQEDGRGSSGWIEDDEKWVYAVNGRLARGWREIDGERYCFDEDGTMYARCFTYDGIYVDENGRMAEPPYDQNREAFTWDKDRTETGTLSGLVIAGHPAELYMLSIAGETSGFSNKRAVVAGDRGRAYGICQFDYRYDLQNFMHYAFEKNPVLWAGFEPYLGIPTGSQELVYNEGIGNTFIDAMAMDFEASVTDQLEMFTKLYWDGSEAALNAAGFNLGERHISVSAAIFSINVNCGSHTSLYLQELNPEMTDEEMIRKLYQLRNTVMAEERVGRARKGTSTRYLSAEPQMALDMLYGYTTIDSNLRYGGGVEWHGNPFTEGISTQALGERIMWETATPSNAEKAESESEIVDETAEEPKTEDPNAPIVIYAPGARSEIGPGVGLHETEPAESTGTPNAESESGTDGAEAGNQEMAPQEESESAVPSGEPSETVPEETETVEALVEETAAPE